MVNESMKPWGIQLSEQQYDLRVLTKQEFIAKYKITSAAYRRLYAAQ